MNESDPNVAVSKPRANGLWFIVVLMVVVGVVLFWRVADTGDGFLAPGQRKPLGSLVLDTLDGKPWKIEDHLGKVVVINFWATWCPPCVIETPGLVRVANQFAGDDFAMLGVSFDDGPPDKVVDFVARYQIPYPVARPTAPTPTIEAMKAIPVTMLIDRQGRVARTWVGQVGEAELSGSIETARRERRP